MSEQQVGASEGRFGGISRFDKVVGLVVAGALLWLALLVWRGDRVGVQVVQISPADGSENISTQAVMRVTFAQDMVAAKTAVTTDPPITGTVRWEGSTLAFVPAAPLEHNTTYTITVAPDLQSRQGRKLLQAVSWQFRTGQPRLLYIAWDEERSGNQLYLVAPQGGTPTRLTAEPHNVLDYALAPDGLTIAYTATRPDGGSDIWAIAPDGSNRRSLVMCGGGCSNPAWSPDGRRIIYERRNEVTPGSPSGPPRLWWLDVGSRETAPIFEDSQWLGMAANFSPDGRWISYVAPQTQEIHAYNLQTGHSVLIASRTGQEATWSREADTLLLTQLAFQEDDFSVYIFKANLEDETLANLSGDAPLNDGWPAVSPGGEWIAFNRKAPRAAQGKQIWRMRVDGSDAQSLTDNPNMHYGPPAWSLDGRFLTFQAYSLKNPETPSIWVLDVETRELWQVASPGVRPLWLP